MKSPALEFQRNTFLPDFTAAIRATKNGLSVLADSTIIRTALILAFISCILVSSNNLPTATVAKQGYVSNKFAWLTTKNKNDSHLEAISVPEKAATPPCASDVINLTDPTVTECPDLYINFSSMVDGAVNSRFLNIYSGKPDGNQEAQLYTNNTKNISIENGSLTIRALKEQNSDYSYSSARIDTKNKKDFFYGKLEIEATLPNNIGAWPAIWMLATNRKYIGMSPETDTRRYLNDGEIDIAESVGADPNVVYGIAHSLAHIDGQSSDYYNTVRVANNDTTFHKYGILWTPTRLSFTLDGIEYYAINKKPDADYRSWPYDQPFYLIINLAVGGSWGGILKNQYPPYGVNDSEIPFTMKIRTISYYHLKNR